LFDRLRKAGDGTVVKLDTADKSQLVEGVIFEPKPARPRGYETGIFVKVPTETDKIYYLDPEASRKQGKIIMQLLEIRKDKPTEQEMPEELLSEYKHLRQTPEIKMGGGAALEANSKATGTVDLNNNQA
jgi:hypothetical protein